MKNNIILSGNNGIQNDLVIKEYMNNANTYFNNSKSKSTQRAYKNDIDHYLDFCSSLNVADESIESLAIYLSSLADKYKVNTIKRRLASIRSYYPDLEFHKSDKIKKLLKGITKTKGIQLSEKRPLMTNDLIQIVNSFDGGLKSIRDKAILLIGFAGAFRRSELVSLNVADLCFNDKGVTINLRKSKTDQESKGYEKAICFGANIETCPVRSLQKWLKAANITAGAIFKRIDRHGNILGRLTSQSIGIIVKQVATKLGLEENDFGGHSLRAGFATQSAANNVSSYAIKKQGGWSSEIYTRYIRSGSLYQNNASQYLGL